MKFKENTFNKKSIALIGFMGVGKTTIGRLVAQRLQRDFIDIDKEIERKYEMTPSEIFKIHGEHTFRKTERKMVSHFAKQELKVISLGGGAFLQDEIKHISLKENIVIFLDISWESWKERSSILIDRRPVLHGKNTTEMKELYYKRKELYAHHHLKVTTDDLSIEEVTDLVIDSLNNFLEIKE
ncbi:shikimate kinase [Virgibacillus sp. C22-A2]|uniref:Shikimate kinase n=1 Tax=Virgibacillus tibetensis TaxID=3042313 RepID=A0ABU6KJ74_9BACI|nr:shikimate kinase [Virgibacillus sp. C22-A2]